jgi:AcrR family transcriptional regulator
VFAHDGNSAPIGDLLAWPAWFMVAQRRMRKSNHALQMQSTPPEDVVILLGGDSTYATNRCATAPERYPARVVRAAKPIAVPALTAEPDEQSPRALRRDAILQATLEQLAVVGFRALSIEEVALHAGVNKTTIYRRWPTKLELVRAAVESFRSGGMRDPCTGTLRGDLLAVARRFFENASSLGGQSLFRIMALESAEPDLVELSQSFRMAHQAIVATVLQRAVQRGELDRSPDHRLVSVMLIGPIHLQIFGNGGGVSEAFIGQVVDALLAGLLPRDRGKTPSRHR